MKDKYTLEEYRALYKDFLAPNTGEDYFTTSKYLTSNYSHYVGSLMSLLVFLSPTYWYSPASDTVLQNIRSFIHEIPFENIPTYMNVPDLMPYIKWRLHLGK